MSARRRRKASRSSCCPTPTISLSESTHVGRQHPLVAGRARRGPGRGRGCPGGGGRGRRAARRRPRHPGVSSSQGSTSSAGHLEHGGLDQGARAPEEEGQVGGELLGRVLVGGDADQGRLQLAAEPGEDVSPGGALQARWCGRGRRGGAADAPVPADRDSAAPGRPPAPVERRASRTTSTGGGALRPAPVRVNLGARVSHRRRIRRQVASSCLDAADVRTRKASRRLASQGPSSWARMRACMPNLDPSSTASLRAYYEDQGKKPAGRASATAARSPR